eukprot:TRINITY_DN32213_c0_g1_i1.p1 TRINITY_DN32213_c0_g1~~TRINITY_DN32213_c0_g1_i1.p1  ORF type:complete len:493 (+),score=19.54 TRINITY_DN32213_c0_g1_i1:36-1514(+)
MSLWNIQLVLLTTLASATFQPPVQNQSIFGGVGYGKEASLKRKANKWRAQEAPALAIEHPKASKPPAIGVLAYARLREELIFIGLGICHGKPLRRSFRQSSPLRCLQSCVDEPECRFVSYSQRRGECVLATHICGMTSLRFYSSYASFAVRKHVDPSRHDVRFSNDIEIALGRTPTVDVYAFASVSHNLLVEEVVKSVEMAGESAVFHIFNSTNELSNKYVETAKDRDAVEFFLTNMWKRAKEKWDTVIRAIWENVARGHQVAVYSDLDIQFFPGWTELVRGCTDTVLFCFGQSVGYYSKRTRATNGGFLALRTTPRTLQIALDLVAEYEKQWVRGDSEDFLEQEVISQYIFENKHKIPIAFFNPELVQNSQARPALNIRVLHVVSSSNTRSKKLTAMRVGRSLYYGTYDFCVPIDQQGPEHPCCDYLRHSKSIYRTRYPDYPPFLVGGFYGYLPPLNRSIRHKMTLRVHKQWSANCRMLQQNAVDVAHSTT